MPEPISSRSSSPLPSTSSPNASSVVPPPPAANLATDDKTTPTPLPTFDRRAQAGSTARHRLYGPSATSSHELLFEPSPQEDPATLNLEAAARRLVSDLHSASLRSEEAPRIEGPNYEFHVDERGQISLEGLPKDISTLFRLAETTEFTLPPSLNSLARAHGFEGVKFPCQAGSQLVAKLATAEELEKRLAEFQNINPSFSGAGKMLAGAQLFMAMCLVKNILLAAYALHKSSFQPQMSVGLGIASEAVAGFVHAKAYQDISSTRKAHREVSDIRSLSPINIPQGQSLDNLVLAKAVKEKVGLITNDMVSDIPELLCSFLTLLVGNYILAQATIPERP